MPFTRYASTAVLAVLACVIAALAMSPAQAAAAACSNEQLRNESAPNPANGHPYSTELPECRAYEMVSPLEKQSVGAGIPVPGEGTPVSANGETVGYSSEGDFADPENFKVNLFLGSNFYLAHRTATGLVKRFRVCAAPGSSTIHLRPGSTATCRRTCARSKWAVAPVRPHRAKARCQMRISSAQRAKPKANALPRCRYRSAVGPPR